VFCGNTCNICCEYRQILLYGTHLLTISKTRLNNDNYVTTSEGISNGLNNFFSTVGDNLAKDLLKNNKIYSTDFQSYCHTKIDKSIYIEPTDKSELLKLVNKLCKSKSPGPDNNNIRPGLIKEVIEVIVDPLLHIYNLSLNKGIVPDKLKTAKVVPIYKKR